MRGGVGPFVLGLVSLVTWTEASAAPQAVDVRLYVGERAEKRRGAPPVLAPYSLDFQVYSPALVVHVLPGGGAEVDEIKTAFQAGVVKLVHEGSIPCADCDSSANRLSGGAVSFSAGGGNYALGVMFPDPAGVPDEYVVRIHEWEDRPHARERRNSEPPSGTVIPSPSVQLAVRCPRGRSAVVAFLNSKGERCFVAFRHSREGKP